VLKVVENVSKTFSKENEELKKKSDSQAWIYNRWNWSGPIRALQTWQTENSRPEQFIEYFKSWC
jgi:hypothetical protein